jgi:hypothetical protein
MAATTGARPVVVEFTNGIPWAEMFSTNVFKGKLKQKI